MTRSDGKSNYIKLNVDPEKPPGDYWRVGSLKCAACAKLWPKYKHFNRPTLCCGASFVEVKEQVPDMTWREAIRELLSYLFWEFYCEWNEDLTDEELVYLTMTNEEWVELTSDLTNPL